MKTYTVIGFYDDTDQVFAESTEAADQYAAMGIIGARTGDPYLVLIGAIEGEHEVYTPGDDNGSTCYASEMVEFAPARKEV